MTIMTSRNRALILQILLSVILTLADFGCGSSSVPSTTPLPPPAISVAVSPATATVIANGTQLFTPTVTNDSANKGANWTVTCSAASCGTVSPAATPSSAATTYTAPSAAPASNLTVTLTATSVSDATKSMSATITVPAIAVSVSPTSANVVVNTTQQFTGTTTNDPSNGGVTWTVSQNGSSCSPVCGTIAPASTASGAPITYTAPPSAPSPNTVTITATSATDTTKSVSSTVTVIGPIAVSVAPTSAVAVINKTNNFTATVQDDSANKGVTWALTQKGTACTPGCGTVSPASTASGAATTYTAPASVPVNPAVTITATSVSDTTKSSSAAITIYAVAQNPEPLLNQPLAPDTVAPGSAAFKLTVNGTGFVSGSVVNWNGTSRATTFVSSSQLTASILASDVATAKTATVTVVSPSPGGGTSNAVFFSVTPSNVSVAFNGSTFPTATGPTSVATGDFNGDGKLDLVVTDSGSGSVSVLLGNGDGTFQAPVNYTVGTAASSQFLWVAVGDVNGDGKPDFVVADCDDNYVDVFLGNGDGTFQAGVTYAVGTNPTSVALADLNADGKLDVVVSNQNCPNDVCGVATASVLLGNGDGTFQAHSDYPAGGCANWVAVGDFNRDGILDLAVVNGNGGGTPTALLVLLGNGDGTFQAPTSYPLNTNGASASVADFNGDGKLDVAVVDNSGFVSILLGNGDGTFQARTDYPVGSYPFGNIGIGDLNGDGELDIAVADSGSNSASVLLGNGDGTFQSQLTFPTGNVPQGLAAGDFSQDGRLGIAVSNKDDNTVSILLQVSTVTLAPATLNFSTQPVGTATAPQSVTLTNNGPFSLSLSAIAITGTNNADFPQTNSCAASLAVGASCTINVTFTPSQAGPEAASLAITDGGGGSPQSVSLSGIGLATGPNATFSPTSLTFATQLIGVASAAQTVTLTNYGTAALTITGISAGGDFAQTNNCGTGLATLASCTVNVTFTPTQSGTRTGALSFTDNAPGSPQTVALTGVGTVIELSPSSLNLGNTVVGGSKSQTTTLTNTGSVTLNISGISIIGDTTDFSQTNTCAAIVAAGKSCVITVTFDPGSTGTKSANVSLADDGGGSPQLVPLSGKGCTRLLRNKCVGAADSTSLPPVRSAITQNRIIAVPPVSGPRRVGTRVVRLVDSSRQDPFASSGGQRELLVRFWYPTNQRPACQPAAYVSPRTWAYYSQIARLPLPEVTTNSCQDAPVTSGAHPVVLFTPGYTATFTDYTFLLEDLASRGYVVASVDHTYEATVVEFPDGRMIQSAVGSHFNDSWQLDEQTLSQVLATRQADLEFVVNQLEQMNTIPGAPFNGKLDTSRIGLMGHSLGGEATLTGLQQDQRFRAGVLLEGAVADESVMPTSTPLLILAAGRVHWDQNECSLWSNLTGPHVAVNLQGGEHLTPSDAVWLAKGAISTGTMGPDRAVAAIRDYVAAFFDENLQGRSRNPLLNGPSLIYPDAAIITDGHTLCSQP